MVWSQLVPARPCLAAFLRIPASTPTFFLGLWNSVRRNLQRALFTLEDSQRDTLALHGCLLSKRLEEYDVLARTQWGRQLLQFKVNDSYCTWLWLVVPLLCYSPHYIF